MNVSWTTYSSEQSLFDSPVEGHPQATRERMGRKLNGPSSLSASHELITGPSEIIHSPVSTLT